MSFDYKKEEKYLYLPPTKPTIVEVPPMNYVAVRGEGNPNEKGSTYEDALGILYSLAYTLKMSYKGPYKMKGFFEYVVPPLEGFWWQENVDGIDYNRKKSFQWISVIRLPDFIKKEDLSWAVKEVEIKKKIDCSLAEFLTIKEGLCVQMMHHGPYDEEPATIAMMEQYLQEQGYVNDFTKGRLHHEIYLSDPRKVELDRLKTVIRHPIKKKS